MGGAAKSREASKNSKWKPHAEERHVDFAPVVFEASGRFGDSARSIISWIASRVFPFDNIRAASYRKRLTCKLSLALAFANALIVEEAVLRAKDRNAPTLRLFRGLNMLRVGVEGPQF